MQKIISFFDFITWARENPDIIRYVNTEILAWVFISLFFGFIVVLFELRLPLKYYWNIPIHAFRSFLEGIRILPQTPIWGYCLDRKTKQIIPVAAVELIDEQDKQPIATTYSNRLGQYGFRPPQGKYLLRAVKNHYQTPSALDPENIQLIEVKESYATPIKIGDTQSETPHINIELQPIEQFSENDPRSLFSRYGRNLMFTMANAFLGLAIVLSFISWAITKDLHFGILLLVSIVLLFIKIYILETIGQVT